MKKETIIKIILLIIYYFVFYFLLIKTDLMFPVFDFGKLDFSNVIRLVLLLIHLLFPLSILFVSFKKKKILSIVLSVSIICTTYFPTGFVFKIQNFYKSYTEDIDNYLQFDKPFWEIHGFDSAFPKEATAEDKYYYYYNYEFLQAVPDAFVMLKTNNQIITDVEDKLSSSCLVKTNTTSITYYSTSQDVGAYLYVIINYEANSITYLYITKERFPDDSYDFNNYIIENLLYLDTTNYTEIKQIFLI